MMSQTTQTPITHTFIVSASQAEQRIDQLVAELVPLYSRTFIQKLIEDHHLTINNKAIKRSYRVQEHDCVTIVIPSPTFIPHDITSLPEIPIIFEHEHFLVIGKPAGLIVHKPSEKFKDITLVDWITTYFSDIKNIGNSIRPGIIHRLDKDTSGIMIIAKTSYAHLTFTTLFKTRKVSKTYYALVEGNPPDQGTISARITRHPVERHKMQATQGQGRQATTGYKVVRYFQNAALIEAKPITGRTHQIRVHLASIGHPIIADHLYGHHSSLIKRQALHAYAISFPFDGQEFSFFQQIPDDFDMAIRKLSLKN